MQAVQLGEFIPPDARNILEFSDGQNMLVQRLCMINPACQYWCVTHLKETVNRLRQYAAGVFLRQAAFEDLAEIGLQEQSLDCIVYSGQTQSFLLNDGSFCQQHLTALKSGGQVIYYLENWQYLKKLCLGEKSTENLISLEELRKCLKRAGISVYETIPYFEEDIKNLWENKDKEIFSCLERLSSFLCIKTLDPESLLAKGFIIRGVKGTLPKKLSLQTYLGETVVCARPRIYEPHAFCQTQPNVKAVYFSEKATILPPDGVQRVFIWQRRWLSVARMQEALQSFIKNQYLVIAECDDDPFFRMDENQIQERRFSLTACHGIQVSTPALAAFLQQFHPEVAVFQNQLLYLPPPREFLPPRKVTLFFGALNRKEDWRPWMPQLNKALKRYREKIAVKVVYDKEFFTALEIENKEFFPFCAYEQYVAILRQSDLAFLPLGDTRMNRMKSDLKFLECAGHGVCVLASPIVYAQTVEHGITGLIYRDEQDFELGLAALIEDDSLRKKMREAAYLYVKENRLLCQHYKERLYWYQSLLNELPAKSADLLKRIEEALKYVNLK